MEERKESMPICNGSKRGCHCKEARGRCLLKEFNEISVEIYRKYSDGTQKRLTKYYNRQEDTLE